MTFAPEAPTTTVAPTGVDADTWVIPQVQHALGAPLSVYLNSMVIAGSEPAIVGSEGGGVTWTLRHHMTPRPSDLSAGLPAR